MLLHFASHYKYWASQIQQGDGSTTNLFLKGVCICLYCNGLLLFSPSILFKPSILFIKFIKCLIIIKCLLGIGSHNPRSSVLEERVFQSGRGFYSQWWYLTQLPEVNRHLRMTKSVAMSCKLLAILLVQL